MNKQRKLMTKQEVIEILQKEYNLNKKIDVKKIIQNPRLHYAIMKYFDKSIDKALKEIGIDQKVWHKITAEECYAEIKRVYEKYGKVTGMLLKKEGVVSIDSIRRHCGGIQKALQLLGISTAAGQRKNIAKEEVVKELKRLEKEFGYVSKPMMEKNSYINPKVIKRVFGSFDQMYKELNIMRSPNGYVPTTEELIEEYKRLCNEFGEKNVTQELITQESKFSTTCFKDRFGSFNKLRTKLGYEKHSYGMEKVSKSAEYCIKQFEKFIGANAIREKTFDWLRNPETNYPLRIDAYFEELKIGLEYNGPQHYKVFKLYSENEKALQKRKELDILKINLCNDHGIKIVTIKYTDKITTEFIKQKLS